MDVLPFVWRSRTLVTEGVRAVGAGNSDDAVGVGPTMRAITYPRYGDPSVLTLSDLPVPKVAPGAALVRVHHAAVNPVDWKLMAGGLDALLDAVFPVVPGWDVSGVVEAVGPDTPEVQVGDRVASYARKDVVQGGTFAEFVAVPVASLAPVPDNVSLDVAAALPLTGLTALRAFEAVAPHEGDVVVIHAASGGVGFVASQLMLSAGARVIGTASPRNFDKLRSIGVEPVAHGENVVGDVRRLAPGGVDAVVDLVGGVLEQTLAVLAEGGRHVSIADPRVMGQGGRWLWVRPDGPRLSRLLSMVADGELEVAIGPHFPLEQVPEAFSLSMAGKTSGKILIDVLN